MKRYDPFYTSSQGCWMSADMEVDPEGDWVSWEDAEALEVRCERLEQERNELKEQLLALVEAAELGMYQGDFKPCERIIANI